MKRTNGSWKKGFATLGIVTLVVALVGCEGGGLQQAASETADVSSDAPEQPAVDISSVQQKLDDLIQRQQEATAEGAAERAALEKEIADLRVLLDASPAEVWVGTDCDDFYEEAAPDDESAVWVGTDCDDSYEEATPDDEFAEDAASGGQETSEEFEGFSPSFWSKWDAIGKSVRKIGIWGSKTAEVGEGISGQRSEVRCDSGSVISALDLSAGGVIDSIRFLCSPVLQLNNKNSATFKGSSFGGGGGDRREHGNLGPFSGAALNGMKVKICSYQNEAVIAELLPFFTRMTGNNISEDEANMDVFNASNPDQPPKGRPHGMGAYSTHNTSCSDWQQIICPDNQVATGAVVQAGRFVNGLQFICQDQQALLGNAQAKQ